MLRNNLFFFVPFALAIGLAPFVFSDVFGAEIPHVFIEETAVQSHTGDTIWQNLTTATIDAGNFTAGRKYLIITSAYNTINNQAANGELRTLHGNDATQTVFAESFISRESNTNGASTRSYPETWFTVWTAIAGEGIRMQQRTDTTAQTVLTDQITLTSIEISKDLTENED